MPQKVAVAAEERNTTKYANLGQASSSHCLGVFGPRTSTLVRELGRKMCLETGESRSYIPVPVYGSSEGKSCSSDGMCMPL